MRISDWSSDVCSSDLGVQMPIPQSVTASSALTQRQAYSGELPLSSFERLREVLVDDAGVLQVELHAEKSRGAKRLQGTVNGELRSEEHTSELQSLMRISYAVFCLKTKKSLSLLYI